MRKILFSFLLILALILGGCTSTDQLSSVEDVNTIKIGIMLSDVGLGDQSFSDAAFHGLMKARDELNILFDYRELSETETYEQGLTELVEAENDVVVGLGFMVQEDIEKVAQKYPEQKFILIDSVSELDNITSITFKEDEGSFLAGVAAALATKTNKLGFIGGADVPLINKFANGFLQGAKSINPDIEVVIEYAGDFGNDQLGATMASQMISNGSDVLYAAAGFTGVGVLREAQNKGIYAIGVDSDQYFYAEKAVITSMLKNVDVALYQVISTFVENGELPTGHVELGLKENGVDLAPIRIIPFTEQQLNIIETNKENIKSGTITVTE
ncbi:basic membrane protein A [Bacillus mesophilus]|uniref:BMP family ABC transporter substrate-binding protein n=1 Tax=Bacillus mesophilus TaxID=1808955 RepID=A0A6M0Q2N5_9BACI|nr:BMP family ABC transporter substrate-binding protein [Bacillus mesophilus]MBM7659796.1 basic membrane protein A [Bacillus mesophilus]NEY70655.1 BMP family ABC transporter substrate-binding protein [Bacillus mesophilus]